MSGMERLLFVGKSGVAGAGVALVLVAGLSFFFLPSMATIEAVAATSSLIGGLSGVVISRK